MTDSSVNANAALISARETLDAARVSFANANVTLSTINAAMETGDRALIAAEKAFNGADTVINDDIPGMITNETTLDDMNAAIASVAVDLPVISADLRAASTAAAGAFAQLQQVTDASGPAVREFATTALPLYTRLAQESRTLIGNLDRLTSQVQRDPARFFLDRETPEFKR